MTGPPLSVVVATYNQADWVGRCLASIRAGGVPDTEIIVTDDGSTDDTRQVVAATDPQAVYLWAANSGSPSAPRNRGLAAARGRYVTFLDADDAWLPGAAARAIGLLNRYPQLDVLFADARFGNATDGFQSWIELAGQQAFRQLPRQQLEPALVLLEQRPFFRHLTLRNAVCLGASFVKREVFAATGGFDTTYWGGEDWELWMRLAVTRTFGFLDEPLSIYTRHAGNVTNDRDRMTGGFCQALRNVLDRCDLPAADRRWVRDRLRQQLFSYAYLAYDRGDLATARQRFARAMQAGNRRPLTVALAASCYLPPWLAARLRRLKQRLMGT